MKIHTIIRDVKYSRIEIGKNEIKIVTNSEENAKKIIKKYKNWIERKILEIKEINRKIKDMCKKIQIIKRDKNEFSHLIENLEKKIKEKLKVNVKEIKFRKMKKRWGSCSKSGIITLNKKLFYLPENLVEYVLFHEMLHLKIFNHNKEFKRIIEENFPNYKELDLMLEAYRRKLN